PQNPKTPKRSQTNFYFIIIRAWLLLIERQPSDFTNRAQLRYQQFSPYFQANSSATTNQPTS
ncbi:MAG: hypothetical protein ACKO96_41085, partial [Flammeovirgaceae bacterium]